ncbi:MAG TPA: COR domain-containing protein [Thermoanaerobaculia bacterium]|nr:COR domain-containing protein [Thermoanaerobaculia bacterium]
MASRERESAELLALIEKMLATDDQSLDLSNRPIATLPREIGTFRTLRTLKLPNTGLRKLPAEIGQLQELEVLVLDDNGLTELPSTIGRLQNLQELSVADNHLAELPDSIGELGQLRELSVGPNPLHSLPPSIGGLHSLKWLWADTTDLQALPHEIGMLRNLEILNLDFTLALMTLPPPMAELTQLKVFSLRETRMKALPKWFGRLEGLEALWMGGRRSPPENIETLGHLTNLRNLRLDLLRFARMPDWIRDLRKLTLLTFAGTGLHALPGWISELAELQYLNLSGNRLQSLPDTISSLSRLDQFDLRNNELVTIPPSIARLPKLREINLEGNPLSPALRSAYEQGLGPLRAFLRSLNEADPLYEAKLMLIGEGNVGKTTLLKALTGREPRKGEPTTHGVSIDIHALYLPHPEVPTTLQFNAWDFGGQEVYRVTHQFFFSPRSIYLLVWEPRMGVQQCQVEDWLKLIRVRVGENANVIIVSTHAKTGGRIARIDQAVFMRDYGTMIRGFVEVDSLVADKPSKEPYGIRELKNLISNVASGLDHMGMPFPRDWKKARDRALEAGESRPHVSYGDFATLCEPFGLDATDIRTLATLMHDLGYFVYYGDDERLRDDVVLKPEWLTKAIGFVLEDRLTAEGDGILPDDHLANVWLRHSFANEPRYETKLYPFFLRLMEKYDVSYRLEEGNASLVAQHVPQVRPLVPWLPEEEPAKDLRRLAMVCVIDEDVPPGLIPWLIVRTHPYAAAYEAHRLHWQKGMFLRNRKHGSALLELRGRELHLHVEAVWPDYFMNVLQQIVDKLIRDNWPGLENRFTFKVPCRGQIHGEACRGRFDIAALRQFLNEGDETRRCELCRGRFTMLELLFGFEEEEPRAQLARIERKLNEGLGIVTELESRLANSVMAIMRAMADEAKEGPRIFDVQPVGGSWKRPLNDLYRLRLWCEAEGCEHPVMEPGKGIYEFSRPRGWVVEIAPYAKFVAGMLKTVLPVVAPGVNAMFGANTTENLGIKDHLDLMSGVTGALSGDLAVSEMDHVRKGVLTVTERHGLLALHTLLRELDPHHANLGLHRVPLSTGTFLWLCETHYELSQPKIPDRIM